VGWQVVSVAGGPRQRGRAYGEQARDRVHRTIALYESIFAAYASLSWSEVRDRAGRFAEAIDAYDEQALPEIEGIAEGAGLDAEDVLAANLRTEIMFGLDTRPGHAAMKECTAMGVAGAHQLVAQTWDWKPGARDTVVLLVGAPHDRPGFVTIVEAGLLAKCGMNETGIAVALNALQSSADRGEPGVPLHVVLRRALTSGTFEEAVDAIERGPRASSGNYLVGARDGRVVDLEVLPGGPDEVFRPPSLAHTNHFLRPTPRPFKDLARLDGDESVGRFDEADGALAVGDDLATITATLRSHDRSPDSICQHGDPSEDPALDHVTVAAMIADPVAGTLHAADGNPCERPFEAFDVASLLADARSASEGAPTR
jgi:isopenicillin-N N-acyltransferase like protein